METTERIVESYCRYVKGYFTIANIKCAGQFEIDLLALDASDERHVKRYHIESGVSISGAFSKLTAKEFSAELLKRRVEQPQQRRTLGYFIDRKFGPREVRSELRKFGFEEGNYVRVVVTWGWTADALEAANHAGIELWDFRDVLAEIADLCKTRTTYLTDDTLRTIQLFLRTPRRQARVANR